MSRYVVCNTYEEKLEQIRKWTNKFPYIKPYIITTKDALKYTKIPDYLCMSLVQDYWYCNGITAKYGRKTSMASAENNMHKHTDIYVEGRDGRMHAADTKYVKSLDRNSKMWFEVKKNERSTSEFLFYVDRNSGYTWILNIRGCLEELKDKPRRIGPSGDELIDFVWSDISDKFKAEMSVNGAFDQIKGKLYV